MFKASSYARVASVVLRCNGRFGSWRLIPKPQGTPTMAKPVLLTVTTTPMCSHHRARSPQPLCREPNPHSSRRLRQRSARHATTTNRSNRAATMRRVAPADTHAPTRGVGFLSLVHGTLPLCQARLLTALRRPNAPRIHNSARCTMFVLTQGSARPNLDPRSTTSHEFMDSFTLPTRAATRRHSLVAQSLLLLTQGPAPNHLPRPGVDVEQSSAQYSANRSDQLPTAQTPETLPLMMFPPRQQNSQEPSSRADIAKKSACERSQAMSNLNDLAIVG